jgi:GntR family histidine utilization transcriptional repressor
VKVIDGRMIPRDTMQVGRKDRILALRCLHIADRRVFAVEDRLINLAVVPDAEKADFSQTPPGTWLLQHVPWTEAEHKISAAPAAALAPSLGVGPETACLILERRTWRSGTSITYVKQTFPGSDFDLTARFMSNA